MFSGALSRPRVSCPAATFCLAALFGLSAAADAHSETWSGIYIGGHAGYGWGDTSIGEGGTAIGDPHVAPYGAFACAPAVVTYCDTPMKLAPEGAFGGGQLGINWQSGVIVFGGEGDFGWTGIDDDQLLLRPANDRDIGSVDYEWYATLTGRLGYAANDTLIYIKGGAAFADISITAADIDFNDAKQMFEVYQGSYTAVSGVRTGWTIGGGVEHMLTDDISLKAEYLYMDFGSETSRSSDGDIYKHENQLHTVKAGLNVRLFDLQ